MKSLRLSTRDNYCSTSEATGALLNILRLTIARDDDEDDDPDSYWHP